MFIQKLNFSQKVQVEKVVRKRNPKEKLESVGGKSNRKIKV